ncbi:MAG: TonB C-terminal domain-containing protein, partial [Candidatus Competibacteraceae bacterium]|nr:TonB C-terminal domain-containing protein [Candidatus Competibacteraceae bacterium]
EAKRKVAAAAEAKRKAEAEAEAKRKAAGKRKAEAEAEAKRRAEKTRKAEAAQRAAQELAAAEFAKRRIEPYIKRQWSPAPGTHIKLNCEVIISVNSTGAVTRVRIVKSSGDAQFDDSVKAAIFSASPLPMPTNDYQATYIAKQSLKIRFSLDSN